MAGAEQRLWNAGLNPLKGSTRSKSMSHERLIRQAPFALRVVERKYGNAAIVYQRRGDENGRDRLQRLAAISSLAFTAGAGLLSQAVAESIPSNNSSNHSNGKNLTTGKFHPLDSDWGPRVACYALIAARLYDGERLLRAANHIRHADANEAAWWLGLLTREDNVRALRAFRILTEAVE